MTDPRPWCRRTGIAAFFLAGGMMCAMPASAQVSTATLRGQITANGAAAQAGLAVRAVNQGNGNTYRTITLDDGRYVLTGLAPGVYEITIDGGPGGTAKTETITLQVGQTAALDLALGDGTATDTQRITIVGSAQRQGVRDSQLGTYVSPQMIQNLPQVTRNFLSSVDLAPGVAFSSDNSGNTKIQGGAQNFDHVNVFIDGVGQKNNILRGGLSGQDSSRGNPFPQSAIAEYRVITQNYKAEFDQVSSAAVTAVTKSGTNEFHAEGYVDRTGTNWRAKSVFEKEREAQGIGLPGSSKIEFGVAAGGAIQPDSTHYFFAYDGKRIEDSRQVSARNLDLLPAGVGIVPDLIAAQGSQVDPFVEHLLFGKIDAQLNDDQRVSASLRVRRETDRTPESRDLSAPGNDVERSNDETRLDLLHEWAGTGWLSEARAGYEDYVWNPQSAAAEPFIQYKLSTATPQSLSQAQDVLFVGGSPNVQKRGQKGVFVSEDFTYTALRSHVIKGGVKFKALKYDLSGTAFGVDKVETLIDTVTGLPYYDGTNCTGTTISDGGNRSDQCAISRAAAPTAVNFRNNQIGLYIQDDWAVTDQLELNVGVRYDYETNMLNNGYTTPSERVAAIFAEDVPRVGITPPPGQTYAQSLALGGIDIEPYISTGDTRKPFKGAIAPRLGASYDVFADRSTVLFGGYGRSYDRTIANNALDELQKNAQPGGEIWLIRNDFDMPFADQFSVGLRQAIGEWNGEISLSRVDAKNQFIWFSGNRDPNGGFGTQSPIDPLFGGPNGFGSLLLGDFVGRARTDSVFVKAEKPYTAASGWTVTIAYTYSDAKTTHREWNNEIFDFTYGKPGQEGLNPSILVDKHRLVAAGVADNLLPWGLTLSAKATWASGQPRRITDCHTGFTECVTVEGDSPSFRQVDFSISKATRLFGGALTVRADVLNLFNTTNYGGFDDFGGGPPAPDAPANALGGDNLNLGKPNSIRGDTRTFRLMLGYKF
jgi:outer membrane receptor protein involved in Fe transport